MNEQWMALLVQLRKRYSTLTEVYDLTVQMGEALDRDDGQSFSMLLSMRQEPLLRMQELDQNIRRIGETSASEIQGRWQSLQDGDAPHSADEDMVVKQMQQNKRLIDRLVPLDSRINQSLAGRK